MQNDAEMAALEREIRNAEKNAARTGIATQDRQEWAVIARQWRYLMERVVAERAGGYVPEHITH
jgi:hypothetical protein